MPSISLKLFGGLPSLAIYVGIGALFHAVFVGAQFDWSSAWTWGWLFGWPVMVLITFWAFVLALIAVALLVVGIVVITDRP